jgi:hypothetical protein
MLFLSLSRIDVALLLCDVVAQLFDVVAQLFSVVAIALKLFIEFSLFLIKLYS